MLSRFNNILENLNINEKRMLQNTKLYGGVIFSQKVLLKLTEKGLSREEAYRLVQKNAHKVFGVEDGDFKKADEYLERVLDINPQCSDAYYGKLMCKLNVKNKAEICKTCKKLSGEPYFTKALRYADDNKKTEYNEIASAVEKNYNKISERKKNEIKKLKEEYDKDFEELKRLEEEKDDLIKKKNLYNFLQIADCIPIVLFFGLLLGGIGNKDIALTIVVGIFLAGFIFLEYLLIKKFKRMNILNIEFNNKSNQLKEFNETVNSAVNDYNRWVSENK